jgi:hypothetical protein
MSSNRLTTTDTCPKKNRRPKGHIRTLEEIEADKKYKRDYNKAYNAENKAILKRKREEKKTQKLRDERRINLVAQRERNLFASQRNARQAQLADARLNMKNARRQRKELVAQTEAMNEVIHQAARVVFQFYEEFM